jgi:sterol desaturase/sphingolipid hydroxylase (fatty acid hydroxylase superfamily)
MFERVAHWWVQAIDWLSAHAVEPALASFHLGDAMGNPDDIAEGLLIALVQVAIIAGVFRPLESLAPAEIWTDRKLTHVDRRFTLLLVLVVNNPLFLFIALTPLANLLGGTSESAGTPFQGLLHFIPNIDAHPYLAFGIYYVVYDLSYYGMHRLQHAIPWWWALHSMHHSQRQVSCWTNERVSWLDIVLQSTMLATVGHLMGVDVGQFALLVLSSQLLQELSHTNTRIGWGRILERVFVDPRFHRLHHMRVDPSRPKLHDCNYGQVLTLWDNLFRTALYGEPARPTGVGDPTVDADNGRGVLAMQWYTVRRFWGAFTRLDGWKPQEVAFDENYRPVPVRDLDPQVFAPGEAVQRVAT